MLVLEVNFPVKGSMENMSVALSRVNLIKVCVVFARSLSVAFTCPIGVPKKQNTDIFKHAKKKFIQVWFSIIYCISQLAQELSHTNMTKPVKPGSYFTPKYH